MKMNKKLGEVLEIKDLKQIPLKMVNTATLPEIQKSVFVTRVSKDLIVIYGSDNVYFLKIENPAQPVIISTLNLKQDPGGYANMFLGFYKEYALFNIGYQGIEIVNISDLQNPFSLGLVKEYGPACSKIVFRDNLCINQYGIYEVSDILRPKVLKRFETQVFDLLLIGNNLVISTDTGIHAIKMNGSKKFDFTSTFSHEFLYGSTRLEKINEKYILVVSDGLGVIKVDEKIELKVLINVEVVPESINMFGKSCILRTIPYWGNVIVSFNLEDLLNPRMIFALDTEELWYFTANEEYIVYLGRGDSDNHTLKKSIVALKNHSHLPPEIIGVIETEISSNVVLIDNIIYLFKKNGLKLFEIQ